MLPASGNSISVTLCSDLTPVAKNGLGNLCYKQSMHDKNVTATDKHLEKNQQFKSHQL